MARRLVGLSKDNWIETSEESTTVLTTSAFIKNNVQLKDISLIRRNEPVCWCVRSTSFYDVLLEGNTMTRDGCLYTTFGRKALLTDLISLPYLPHRENDTLYDKFKVREEWFFPVSLIKDKLYNAVFRKKPSDINRIIRKHYTQYRKQKQTADRIIAFTSHKPNSVAFSVFSKGDQEIINFALRNFKINASHLNRLRLGVMARHPSEILVRRGEFKILGELMANHGLRFKGKRIDSGLKFYIPIHPIFSALEKGDNMILQEAIQFCYRQYPWTFAWENIRREDGATPLQLAVSEGRADLLDTLIKGKAPVNELGWCQLTPLQFALDLKSSGKIVALLLKHKAAVNVKK